MAKIKEPIVDIQKTTNILGQGKVYISLTVHDWSQLERLVDFENVFSDIQQCQTIDIHLFLQDQKVELETEYCKSRGKNFLIQFWNELFKKDGRKR